MKVVDTLSSQIFFTTIENVKYRIDSVVEYILEDGRNEFKYNMYEVIESEETFELKRLGKKLYQFESWNKEYIEEYTKGKMVKYTQKVIEKLAEIALR